MTIDQIVTLHNYNIDITTKTITLTGEVNDEMADNALKNLHILNQTNGAITIYISTEGGDLSAAKIVYDAIKYSSNVVRIVCFSNVMSCGSLILMAGDERIMSPHSKLLTHIGSEGLGVDHPRNLDQAYSNLRDDEIFIEAVYLDRMNEKLRKDKKKLLTHKNIKDMLIFDRYIGPEEALKLGLITSIGYRLGE
jgi:ATP-dependent protease ClpP protease subunit